MGNPSLYSAGNGLPVKASPRTVDEWIERALRVMQRVYRNQYIRTRRAITEAERAELLAVIQRLYGSEPSRVKTEVLRLFDDVANEAAAAALVPIGNVADPVALTESILTLANRAAGTFAARMSETSLRLVYSTAQDWLDTEGATLGDLTGRMRRIWEGPRPQAAAVTEVTRLVANSEIEAWKNTGGLVVGYQPVTRNDSRVRPKHRRIAEEGPYPLDDAEHVPPYGDVNCRCFLRPILADFE